LELHFAAAATNLANKLLLGRIALHVSGQPLTSPGLDRRKMQCVLIILLQLPESLDRSSHVWMGDFYASAESCFHILLVAWQQHPEPHQEIGSRISQIVRRQERRG